MEINYRSVSDGKNVIKERGRFTNTAVPIFDGAGCWQQQLQIVQAIVKSNGWSEGMAALKLFAHLDGKALNVALLMLNGEREKWEGLSNGLSEYYNSPGRLAVVRLRFESAIRRPGMDPGTFATELGILAVRGFGDMGKRACDAMIRDKFIAAQRHCGPRRHLDGVASDTPIWEIVDSCRVWESHSDREPSPDDDQDQDSRRQSDDPRKLECPRTGSQEVLTVSVMDSRVPVSRVGEEDGQLAPLQAISLLVTRLLHAVQDGRPVEEKAPLEGKMSLVSAGVPVCFLCGRQGHGVNRCSRVDTSFPFLPPGWSVDVRNGQYRA